MLSFLLRQKSKEKGGKKHRKSYENPENEFAAPEEIIAPTLKEEAENENPTEVSIVL